MGAGIDPFWVPPEDFGPPRDLGQVAEQVKDVANQLAAVVRTCHAVRPRVNMRPTVRALERLQGQLLTIADLLVDAQRVLEADAPLASDFPGSDQTPWVLRENPLLSPRQLLALRNLALPPEERHDGLLYVGQPISYTDVLHRTEAEPHHIMEYRRHLATSIANLLEAAEELTHPALDHACPRCAAPPHEGCHTPSGVATRTHKVRLRLAAATT